MAKKQEGLFLFSEVEEITADLSNEQLGELLRAAFGYKMRGEDYGGRDPLVRMAFRMIVSQIDRGTDMSRKRQEAAAARWQKASAEDTAPAEESYEEMQTDANGCKEEQADAPNHTIPNHTIPNHTDPIHTSPIHTDPIHSHSVQTNRIQKNISKNNFPAGEKIAFGNFGWIKLTKDEYDALGKELGTDERDRCIRYLDELTQSNGNKNGYRDWYLVISRCSRGHWGKRGAPKEKVIYGCTGPGQAELEAIQRVLREPLPEIPPLP